MDNPLCSILLPSFKGILEAEACIRSIWSSCDNPDRVEICLRLQTNDPASLEHIPEFLQMPGTIRVVVGLPYGGYGDNNRHFQDVADIAHGDWIWLMNDDCVVRGQGWDTRLSDEPKNAVLIPSIHKLGGSTYERDPDCGAVLVPNKSWEQFEGRTIGMPPDRWLRNALRNAGWPTRFLDVTFWHQRKSDIERTARFGFSTP